MIKKIQNYKLLKIVFVLFFANSIYAQITVSSVQDLVVEAAKSDQQIVMTPGVYQMQDYLTPSVISSIQVDAFNRKAMITFSGSNNTFDFTGVTIEVNTELLNDFGTSIIEFYVTGNNVNIKGLTITDIGNYPTSNGGQSFTIYGDDVTVEDVTINVNGSSPYGYGDLLGKGSNNLVPMRKHSGMLVNGLNTKVIGCTINSQAFGHLFFVQGGRNVLFQDCVAEAVTRTTDEMLAETSGPAFNFDFASVYGNYDGNKVITPGYTKSLSEVGFRTYGSGAGNTTEGVTLINCTAKNTRVGFALEVGGPILIRDCEATGCEAGYNVQGVTIENSRGDAVNGPLLYLSGGASEVDLYLMPTEATTTLHAIATIAGSNHKVTLQKWQEETRLQQHSILVGATRPSGTNPFSPLGQGAASGLILNNCTEMPVDIYDNVSSSYVYSNGAVTDNGTGNTIDTTTCIGSGPDLGTGDEGLIDETYDIAESSSDPDPFYGWNPNWSTTYGYMAIDEVNDQLVCTFEATGSYVRFYWRKTDPSSHKINANNYPILAMKGARPFNYGNFTLNLNNASGSGVQFKDGKSENGAESLAYAKLLPGTTDVYYWNLFDIVPLTETWELSGFNCVDTDQLIPISVMKLDYIKTFRDLNALNTYEFSLSIEENDIISKIKLYPNPTNGIVLIKNSQLINGSVKVYDLNGRSLLSKDVNNSTEEIDISNFSNGVYLFKVKVENKEFIKRIVKF